MAEGIEYYLIPINDITVQDDPPQISEAELEALAQSILDTGVLLEPLVVVRTGPESYELLKGSQNYYAALQAQRINPRAAEMVSAFVVESTNLAATASQLQILKSQATPPVTPINLDPVPPTPEPKLKVDDVETTGDTSELSSELLLSLIRSQEKQLSQLVSTFGASTQSQEKQLSQLVSTFEALTQSQEKRFSQLVSTFEVLTQSQEKRFSQLMNVLEKLSASQSKPDPTKSKSKLTKDALKQIAQQHGLKVSSKDTKDQIIELLRQNSIPLSE